MILEVDTKVSQERLAKRYNEVRLLVDKIRTNTNIVFKRAQPEGKMKKKRADLKIISSLTSA